MGIITHHLGTISIKNFKDIYFQYEADIHKVTMFQVN